MFTAYSFGLSHVHWILTNILDMQVESELFICTANLLALMDIILYMNIGKVIKLQRLVTPVDASLASKKVERAQTQHKTQKLNG